MLHLRLRTSTGKYKDIAHDNKHDFGFDFTN